MKNKCLLRIVSGKYRGKGLISPQDSTVRPTSARVKESLFNIIRFDLPGSDFLDVFCGTGQNGIEAASNGANVTFIDKNVSLVNKNISNIGLNESCRVICGDFKFILSSFAKNNEKFDFIFADPPYNEGLYEDIIDSAQYLLKENGKIILEHSRDFVIDNTFGLEVTDKRVYGSRALTFLGGK
ncbi:MAG: 16S rRNA (guanine(966)-N(2))-methyltransferase RsmD [Clostridiales bacterium]|nr:16S rRNA (guanine(966)-N(2))-methyltransferase RsmD [Clostridiales bacterium]